MVGNGYLIFTLINFSCPQGKLKTRNRSKRPYKREIECPRGLGSLPAYINFRSLAAGSKIRLQRPPTHSPPMDFIFTSLQSIKLGFFGVDGGARAPLYIQPSLSVVSKPHIPFSFSPSPSLPTSPSVNPLIPSLYFSFFREVLQSFSNSEIPYSTLTVD